ncbi:MAG: glycoside hydrolase family 97 catalytic domain-containing protein [Vicinamibacterales bacterium]
MRRRILGLVVCSSIALCAAERFHPVTLGAERAPTPQTNRDEWRVASPDGRTAIVLTRLPDGQLRWRATRGNVAVLAPAPLGVKRMDQEFVTGLTLVRAAATVTVADQYQMPHGKRRMHRVSAREQTVTFANAKGARLEVVLRAHDDGVAFRYRFPETDTIARTVTEELTGFGVPAGAAGWIQPQQPVSQYGPAYEDLYKETASGTPAPAADGWAFPALFHIQQGPWVLITESGLDGGYAGAHLAQNAPDGIYRIKFPDPAEGRNVGAVEPKAALPWTLPWRVAIIGDTAPRILESDLVDDLAPATRLRDTSWIVPGRSAWSWWSESDSPKSAARLNAYTDLAAEMTWEYSLVDANWNLMTTGTIADVVAHAKEKKIGLVLWYNSGGPHNNVTEAPRDRMSDRVQRRAEMATLRSWGVKGIKVDFWQSDKQDRIQQYRAVMQDAADYQLLVNFHGATLPRGWEREFPHLVGMEAVLGAEQYKFREDFPTHAAWHNTVLPFTRNVVGAMDYTPVTFTDHKYPRITTNAHELALSVVFQTGVQHFADSIQAYHALPEAPRAFIRQVPAAWDEMRALEGEPGRAVVIARRDGTTWYVGGIAANAAQTASVRLNFLGAGPWQMTLIQDGASDREFASRTAAVTGADVIAVPMRARGGFVMRITKP